MIRHVNFRHIPTKKSGAIIRGTDTLICEGQTVKNSNLDQQPASKPVTHEQFSSELRRSFPHHYDSKEITYF